jgi:hypothetical protein
VCEDLQVLDILALLNVVELFTFPTVQGTEKEKANKARNCRGQIAQNADSLHQAMIVKSWFNRILLQGRSNEVFCSMIFASP